MRSNLFLPVCLLWLFSSSLLSAQDNFFLKDGQRVVFLGDSNTFAGGYVAYIDGYLFTRFPEKRFELINVGLPSETVSGLSESAHPYPRPHVHTRLTKVLATTKPDVVVVCYGMNDGIYHPQSEERFAAHKNGMLKLIKQVEDSGAKIVLVTTPPFDPIPVKTRLAPNSADNFSWMKPYEKYDDVLTDYSEWLISLRKKGYMVIDVHRAINRHLKAMRKTDPTYRVANDGIHPNTTGHWLWAAEILKAWGATPLPVIDRKANPGMSAFGIAAECSIPMPVPPSLPGKFPEKNTIQEALVGYKLRVKGCKREQYKLMERKVKLGNVTKEQLQSGVDLTQFPELSICKTSQKIGSLAIKRSMLLGRAYLTHIGHKRPNTPKGLPLKMAIAQADQLEAQIRELTQKAKVSLMFAPTGN